MVEFIAKIVAGVLHAAIGMKHKVLRVTAMGHGHVPGVENELCVNARAHGPADDFAAVKVHDGGQIKPAFVRLDIGDVAHPLLIWSGRRRGFGQAIGRDRQIMFAVRGQNSIAFLLPAKDAFLAHEFGDSIAAMVATFLGQLFMDAGAAISLAALFVESGDFSAQAFIFLVALARLGLARGPVVITAAGDIQQIAKVGNGILVFQRVDALEALFGSSERMPNVFFKMSRCWRTRSSSRRREATSEVSSSFVTGVL